MNIRHVILGRAWIYDIDVTFYGGSNHSLSLLKVERSSSLDYHQDLAIRIKRI
jgi:hypothetical protein